LCDSTWEKPRNVDRDTKLAQQHGLLNRGSGRECPASRSKGWHSETWPPQSGF
jgi:hypothetical protein